MFHGSVGKGWCLHLVVAGSIPSGSKPSASKNKKIYSNFPVGIFFIFVGVDGRSSLGLEPTTIS